MSASATEAQVITAQPVVNSTNAPNMNEGFSQFHPTENLCDPEQQKQAREQTRHVTTVWCCITCDECCECAECCVDCCENTADLDNDGSADCFDCCADGGDCCSD